MYLTYLQIFVSIIKLYREILKNPKKMIIYLTDSYLAFSFPSTQPLVLLLLFFKGISSIEGKTLWLARKIGKFFFALVLLTVFPILV